MKTKSVSDNLPRTVRKPLSSLNCYNSRSTTDFQKHFSRLLLGYFNLYILHIQVRYSKFHKLQGVSLQHGQGRLTAFYTATTKIFFSLVMYQTIPAVNIPPDDPRGFAHPFCPAPGVLPTNLCPGGPGFRRGQNFSRNE